MTDRDVEEVRFAPNDLNSFPMNDESGGILSDKSNSAIVITDEPDVGDYEGAGLLSNTIEEKTASKNSDVSLRLAIVWMIVNTLATIGIVSILLK